MVGTTLGHYRILQPLGSGGMGEVYLADDTRLKRKVAIKVLPLDVAPHSDRLERFEREAPAVAAQSSEHRHVVVGRAVSRHALLTMEYVDGQTLSDLGARAALSQNRLLAKIVGTVAPLRPTSGTILFMNGRVS